MYIINNNKVHAAQKISKFTITFQDISGCEIIASQLGLLLCDDHKNIWSIFQGNKGKLLLSSAINGFIVFLSCKQNSKIITGEYFSLDNIIDGKLLTDYVAEAQNDAFVDIKEQVVAA